MKQRTSRRNSFTAALVIAATALASCGGGDESTAAEAPASHTVADVRVADDEAELEKVIAQGEELSQLGDPAGPQSELVVSGNAVASVGSAKPEYRSVVEECLPPS